MITPQMNADEILSTFKIPALPRGVHYLSPESIETLRRATEKAEAVAKRHRVVLPDLAKRGS